MAEDNVLPGVPWVESPFFEHQLPDRGLSDTEIRQARDYRENGFLQLAFDMPNFEMAAAKIVADLADHYNGERRIQDAWRFNEDVRRIACHPPIIDLLRLLYGREPIPFQTLNFRVGTEQPLHCDAAHFNSMPERFMCGVWVALEDVDDDNGPLEYVAGTHKLPCYASVELGIVSQAEKTGQEHGEYNALWQRLGPALGLRRQVFTPSQGEALIWAANLLHGGHRQEDRARSRHSQVTHYYFADCAYYTPFLSDPFLGRIQFREITDIRTNRIVPNRYAGRDIDPRLIQDLHPDRGINPRVAGATIGTAADDPVSPAKTDWVACAGRHRFENTEPDTGKIEGRRIFLHPNPGQSPPARLILENPPLPANTTAAAVVTVIHAEAAAVRFRAFAGPAGSALADLTPCGECVCAAGERLFWEFSLPNAAGEVTLVIETAMAGPRAQNNYALAFVEGLRLI